MKKKIIASLILLCMGIMQVGCVSNANKNSVVVYTSVEQQYCEPLFEEFTKETGIKVLPVYDTEANKTTGLVNRIITEADKPVCDVFWNNEFIQTIDLQKKDLLFQYVSASSADIPDAYKDKDGYWTAFGGRARVMLVNCDLVAEEDYPVSIYNFTDGSFEGNQLALAYPAFGTTKTHVAAMYALLGAENARKFYQEIADRGVQIVDGNSVTKDMVVAGQVMVGYTDTDDAKEAVEDGANVNIIFPDQEEGGIGTLITPSTVAIIKNCPDQENSEKFVDYIISKAQEDKLIDAGFFDVSVREDAQGDFAVNGMSLNLNEIYEMLDIAAKDMQEIFTNNK